MGKTIAEKIFEKHLLEGEVKPGNFVTAKIDLVLVNDITGPPAISSFRKMEVEQVFDRKKLVIVPDHFTPNKDIESAENVKLLKDFSKEQGIEHFYEVGRGGVEHVLLPEEGLTLPGMLIVGADSHTCTYGGVNAFATGVGSTDAAYAMAFGDLWFKVPLTMRVEFSGKPKPWVTGKDLILYLIGKIGVDGALYKCLEFGGDSIKEISMDSRFTISNMAIEAGAKAGVFEPDDILIDWVMSTSGYAPEPIYPDPDADYEEVIKIDISGVDLQVAHPHLPSNVKPVSEMNEIIMVDQVFIGSCTNGRMEDLRIAATILKDKKVHPNVRLIVIPATQKIYQEALKEGILEIFVNAGAAVGTPTCGPCLGGHFGILAARERCLSTSNRNFLGRMGHRESEIYLAGPAVAAATAISGHITSPQEI